MTPHDRALIPIVLGVVGHRDIHPGAKEKLTKALHEIFTQFDAAFPNSPKVLLSPLAPGADQLAAEVALYNLAQKTGTPDSGEGRTRRKNWSVRAPLSFPPEDLLRSTSFMKLQQDGNIGWDQESQKKFNDLRIEKDNAVEWFMLPMPEEVPLHWKIDSTDEINHGVARKDAQGNWSITTDGAATRALSWDEILQAKSDLDPEAAALRRAFYAHPGGYIVRHCHTLIALWDNKHIKLPSGTHESVRFQLGGLPLTQYPMASSEPLGFDSDRGPAILLYTPRADDPTGKRENASTEEVNNAGEITVRIPCGSDDQYGLHYGRLMDYKCLAKRSTLAVKLKKLWSRIKLAWGEEKDHSPAYAPYASPRLPSSPEYDQFLSICQAIEDYNTDVQAIPKHDEKYLKRLTGVEADLNVLFPKDDPLLPDYAPNDGDGQPGSSAPISPDLREWFHRLSVVRETAAYLSGTLSKKADFAPVALMMGLLAVIAILEAYAHPPWHLDQHKQPTHHRILLAFFFLGWAMLAAFIFYFWYRRLDERRSDYRALAESLRIRQVWAASGLAGSVADSFVPQVRSELVWIRRALQHVCPPPTFWKMQFDQLPSERKLARFNWVKSKWVQEQLGYHAKRNHKLHKMGNFWRRRAFLCFICGLAILALPYFLPEHDKATSSAKHGNTEDTAQVTINPSKTEDPGDDLPRTTETTKEPDSKSPVSDHQLTFWRYFGTNEHPALFLLFAGGLLIGTAGIIVAIVEKLGIEIRARSHEQAYTVFRGGSRELETTLNPKLLQLFRDKWPDTQATDITKVPVPVDIDERNIAHAQKIIEALGREAALESAQWLLLRRSKPLELPLGG